MGCHDAKEDIIMYTCGHFVCIDCRQLFNDVCPLCKTTTFYVVAASFNFWFFKLCQIHTTCCVDDIDL